MVSEILLQLNPHLCLFSVTGYVNIKSWLSRSVDARQATKCVGSGWPNLPAPVPSPLKVRIRILYGSVQNFTINK